MTSISISVSIVWPLIMLPLGGGGRSGTVERAGLNIASVLDANLGVW